MGKHYNNSQCFKEKNNKAKFSTNLILKKPTKIILEGKKPMKKDVAVIDNVL